jgi:hypothetical protein
MLKIPAVNGSYYMPGNSNGTYHELVAKFEGAFAGQAVIYIKRLGSETYEQYNSFPLDVTVLSSGILLGSIADIRIDLSSASGSGYAEVTLTSRDTGVPDNIAKSRAYVQSIARVYPTGVSLVTPGRPRLNFVAIQNRDNQAIYFWHGLVPTDINQTAYLPLDPAVWTTQQKTNAATFLQTYGESVGPGVTYEPHMAQTGPLYSLVPSGTAIAHVKVG